VLDIDETIHLLAHTAPPSPSIAELHERARAVHVTHKTIGLECLPQRSAARVLWASHVGVRELPLLCAANQLTHLAIYGCPFPDLRPLRQLINVEALSLFHNTKAVSLEGLEALTKLQFLSLASFTKSFSLEPLRQLGQLRFLWLSGTMWTAMRVDSLEPLAQLSRLERLKLSNVRVRDRRLAPLLGLSHLTEIRLPNLFPAEEFAALRRAFPSANGTFGAY